MHRTTIMLPEEVAARLRRLAAERGISMAALICEAIEEKIATSRPRPRSLGIGSSGLRDVARHSGHERPEPRAWR